MEGVEFNEPTIARAAPSTRKPTGLMKLVISLGLAKDEAGAQKVLIVVLILVVLATIFVLMSGGGSSASVQPAPTPEEMQ